MLRFLVCALLALCFTAGDLPRADAAPRGRAAAKGRAKNRARARNRNRGPGRQARFLALRPALALQFGVLQQDVVLVGNSVFVRVGGRLVFVRAL